MNVNQGTIAQSDMKAFCKCAKCGGEAEVDTSVVLTSNPPQYKYHCRECDNYGYIQTSATYYPSKHERHQTNNAISGMFHSNSSYIYNNTEDCSTCRHSEVCRYKDEFMRKLKSLDLNSESFIRLKCECIHYLANTYNITYKESNGIRGILDVSMPVNDDCSTCDFMKKLLTDGSYIGDSPCDYCGRNPYKLTCNTTSSSADILKNTKVVINESVDAIIAQSNSTEVNDV